MVRTHGVLAITLLIFCSVALGPAQARMYRWVDDKGQVHYSDRVPQEYIGKERKEYDEEGRLLSTIDAAKTEAQLAEERKRAAEEAQQRKQAEEQEKADRVLLKTYASAEELEKAREEQIAIIDKVIDSLQDKLKNIKEKQSNLKLDKLGTETATSDLNEIEAQLKMQQKKKSDIAKRFDSYKQRFAKLNR